MWSRQNLALSFLRRNTSVDNKHEYSYLLQEMISTSVCRGLVHVNYYDADKNTLIVNATSPDGVKSKYLIVGEITYEKDI